jgi:predicted O-linked N-acetylglucosamine transferase (SPINDLY family)
LSKNRKQRRSEKSLDRRHGTTPAIQGIFNDALQHHQAGRLAEAEQLYRQTLMVEPQHADTLHLLGVLANDVGRHDVAVELITKAIHLKKGVPAFHNNLGNAFVSLDRLDEALTHYKRALALRPDYAEAFNNLGNIFKEQGKFDEAFTHYRRAIDLKPDYAETHNNLGTVLKSQGKFDDAIASYKRALALKPDFGEAFNNLGNILKDMGKFDEAEACFRQAIAFKPDNVRFFNNMGSALKSQGRLDEAILSYRKALDLQSDSGLSYSNLLMAAVYAASVSPAELAATAREFGKHVADPLRRQRPFVRNRDPERKLRIGYVSPDFRNHAVNYFFEHLLRSHDRQQFEIFAYSSILQDDAVTARLKQEFDHWRNIRFLNDDKAADLIEADTIDILVDMAGHTGDNRLLVFARKPAPVQVTWLGWPATTGMKAMDYRVTDSYAEPPGMTEHLSTETLWRLPKIFCCYQAHENSPAVIDHPPFEDNGYITFGCFNSFVKVTDPVLETWTRILAQAPGSRLLLEINGIDSPEFRASAEERLQRLGLPLARVILEPRKPANQFVLYNRIDIALDPFPCAGGTTSMDTVWMGVPFVTLAGEHFVSRMGVTILTNAGMPELIAKNTNEYVSLAVSLALDKDRLRALRHDLRQKVAASPLMNQPAFARNMEAAYREMWMRWCARES